MTRPEKLVVRLTDTAGPEERGKVDEISAHACINDMSVVCNLPNQQPQQTADCSHESLMFVAVQPDYRTGSGDSGSVTAEELKGLLLSTVELSRQESHTTDVSTGCSCLSTSLPLLSNPCQLVAQT